MPKFRVNLMVDVMTCHLYTEVEAQDEREAKQLAYEALNKEIAEFAAGTVDDACWEVDYEVVPEPDESTDQIYKDEWDRFGEEIKEQAEG